MSKSESLFRSVTQVEDTLHPTSDILRWLERRNREVKVNVEQVGLSKLENWIYSKDSSIVHKSGKFFSIDGVHIETNLPDIPVWDQPIIDQPEIGILGIIAREFDGVLHFLMQAKIEPGNINHVQLSPTLQATRSNFTRVHQGSSPRYLELFLNAKPESIIIDQLQSEQGARFLRKRNRNIIIKVDQDIEVLEDFKWMTLGQIKELLLRDNVVNMDTRTVIAGINFGNISDRIRKDFTPFGQSLLQSMSEAPGIRSFDDHLSWLSGLKANHVLIVNKIPLNRVTHWVIGDDEIYHEEKKYFKVIGVHVSIASREVTEWCQPMIQPMQKGICAFIVKFVNGILHFLVQAKLECGNLDIIEIAPSVQCLTGNILDKSIARPPFLDFVLNADKERILVDVMQSEEGGRFYHEQNRNMIVEVDETFDAELPERYTWMSYHQLNTFLKFNNYVNVQARSLLAAISFYL